eukprot:15477634-Alexandrium_andersonii.AAC.1
MLDVHGGDSVVFESAVHYVELFPHGRQPSCAGCACNITLGFGSTSELRHLSQCDARSFED